MRNFALLALLISGCAVDPSENWRAATAGQDPQTGVAVCDSKLYPCGPFGYGPGSVIANLKLVGRSDSNQSGVVDPNDTVVPISLTKYYQDKNIKALYIGDSAEWCGPCNAEQKDLVAMHNQYKANGGHVAILGGLIESNGNAPADIGTVDRWAKKHSIPFDLVADPDGIVLGPYYPKPAFPMWMIVDTKDMTIVDAGNGAEAGLKHIKSTIDDILAQ